MVSKIGCATLMLSASATSVSVPTVTLNNGVKMPLMSLGTAFAMDGNNTAAEAATQLGLKVGFTAIDTAMDYLNQEGIGRALAQVERDSVFVTTKIGGDSIEEWPTLTVEEAYNRSLVEANLNLQLLNVDYVDLVLIHYPANSFGNFSTEYACAYQQEQWRALEDFMSLGKARAIGVSNYCQSDLACILETATVVPAVNQLLFHVGMGPDPRGLVSTNDALGIQTMAHSPLGSVDYSNGLANATKDNSLVVGNFTKEIGEPYGKTGAQVSLRWLAQHNIPFATGSSSEKHLREDMDVFSFAFDDKDMQQLDAARTPAGEPNGFWAGIPVCESSPFAVTV